MEVAVTTGACMTCKAPVKMSPSTNQHPAFLQARCPSCRPTNSVKALFEEFGSYQAEEPLGLSLNAQLSFHCHHTRA